MKHATTDTTTNEAATGTIAKRWSCRGLETTRESSMKQQPLLLPIAAALTLFTTATSSANPQVPGPPQKQPVALTNATIHPVSSPAIEKGTLVFDGGKITAI